MSVQMPNSETESASGPVKTYTLSPEELAKYRALPAPGGKNPIIHRHQKKKERNEMTVFPKEKYLELRLSGLNRTHIQRNFFAKNAPKFYKQLEEWGIKAQDAEERELELLQAERKAAGEAEEPEAVLEQVKGSIKAEIENQKAKDVEIERLREELAKTIGERNRYQKEIKWLNENLQVTIEEKNQFESEVEHWKAKVTETVALAGKAIADSQPKGIHIHIPIIDGGWTRFEQYKKVLEELDEVGQEIESANVDRRKAAAELFDVIQAFAGLIRCELVDLMVDGDVDEHVVRFFDHFNREHIAKIQRYADERGWRVVGG